MDDDPRSRPMGTYLTLTLTYNVAAWAMAVWLGKKRRASIGDIALLGVATEQVSRIVTQDRVTQAVRSPFVDRKPSGGEAPKREGPRRALGELLLCPYCTGQWIALGLTALFLAAPQTTRAFCTAMAVGALSDFLNRGYSITREKKRQLSERSEVLEAISDA